MNDRLVVFRRVPGKRKRREYPMNALAKKGSIDAADPAQLCPRTSRAER